MRISYFLCNTNLLIYFISILFTHIFLSIDAKKPKLLDTDFLQCEVGALRNRSYYTQR